MDVLEKSHALELIDGFRSENKFTAQTERFIS